MTKHNINGTGNQNGYDYRESLKIESAPGMNPLKYVDLYLNRPVAALIVRAVYHTRITPNGLTYISFFIGFIGALLFLGAEHKFFILGGILVQLSSIIDGADGMLARAKNMRSDFGAHLDLFFDRIIDFALFVCMTIGVSAYYNSQFLLKLGLIGAGLYLLQVNLFYITKSYQKKTSTGETGEFRAIVNWAALILAVANHLEIFLYLGLIETAVVVVVRSVFFISLGRKKNHPS